MNTNKNDKGFTLVELLIVIVILGILATVTVFAVRGITDQGTANACKTDKKTLQVAVEAYFAQEGSVPTMGLLVPDYLVEASTTHQIDTTSGAVTFVTDGECDL